MKKYTASQAAKVLGVSKSTLLRWERERTISPPKREQKGRHEWRFYTAEDLKRIRKETDLPIPSQKFKLNPSLGKTLERALKELIAQEYEWEIDDELVSLTFHLEKDGEEYYLYSLEV
jgi:DNA-binding transcriptional MerR regulator